MPQDSLITDQTADFVRSDVGDAERAADDLMAVPPSVLGKLARKLPMTVFWGLAAQGVLSVTRLLTSMTVGGRFGSGSEEQLGYYSSAFGVLMILVGLHEAFVTTPLTVFNQKKSDAERTSFFGDMLITSLLVIGLIAAVTGMLIAIQASFQVLKPELGAALIAAAALAPLQLVREFSRRWLLANLNVKSSAWLECFFAAIYLLVLGSLVYAANVSAISVFVAIGCVNAVGLAVWWFIYRDQFQFIGSSTSAQVGENFRYGRWVAGENVCSTVTMYLCIWFLTFRIDEAAAGVFFACFTIMMLANPFLLGVSSVLAPRAAQEFVSGGWSSLKKTLISYGVFIFAVLLAFAGVLFFIGDGLTELFFGPRYAAYFAEHFGGENSITATLGMAMPLLGPSFVITMGLLAVNRPQDSFYSALVGLFTLVAVNFSFAQPTLQTAALSFVISIAAGMTCRLLFLIRAYANRPVSVEPS